MTEEQLRRQLSALLTVIEEDLSGSMHWSWSKDTRDHEIQEEVALYLGTSDLLAVKGMRDTIIAARDLDMWLSSRPLQIEQEKANA